MLINPGHPLYAWTEKKEELLKVINLRDCATLCGCFNVGKSRLIKQIAITESLDKILSFIDLNTINLLSNQGWGLANLLTALENLYADGRRVFVIPNLSPDHEITPIIYQTLNSFRRSRLERISLILLSNTYPLLYENTFSRCPEAMNNIIYLSLASNGFFEFILEQNAAKYESRVSEENTYLIRKMSGGIPSIIREYVKTNAEGKDLSSLKSLDFAPLVNTLFDELPDNDLLALKEIRSGRKISGPYIEHFINCGIIDPSLKIRSELISDILETYTRNYNLAVKNSQIFINGNDRTSEFSTTQAKILITLIRKGFISRDTISELAAGEKEALEYSEYSIDKTMSRLRKKLSRLGVNKGCIKTSKKKGFRYEP